MQNNSHTYNVPKYKNWSQMINNPTMVGHNAKQLIFLNEKTNHPIDPISHAPSDNGAILIICKIIDTIMASAMEAEMGATFIISRKIATIVIPL